VVSLLEKQMDPTSHMIGNSDHAAAKRNRPKDLLEFT
jgi:hypothetical protein